MTQKNKAVAIVGMCGCGKSIVSNFFVDQGWELVYFGGLTLEAVRERNMEITPDNEKIVREQYRKEHGYDAYAKILLPKIEESLLKNNTVLDGLYTWSEYKYLKENLKEKLVVLAIMSDRLIRYNRLLNRDIRPLDYNEAYKRDIAEIENLEKGGPIVIADYFILNNSTTDELLQELDGFLNYVKEI